MNERKRIRSAIKIFEIIVVITSQKTEWIHTHEAFLNKKYCQEKNVFYNCCSNALGLFVYNIESPYGA